MASLGMTSILIQASRTKNFKRTTTSYLTASFPKAINSVLGFYLPLDFVTTYDIFSYFD